METFRTGDRTLDSHGSILSIAAAFTAWFFVFFVYHGVGITLGYHRLLTHKSLKVPDWLMYAIVSGGYLCLMGGPVNWVGVHRLHHQKSDLPGDPHSPRDGFWHAMVLWMFTMDEKQSAEELRRQVPDLLKNKVLCWFGMDHCAEQAQLCLAINVFYRCVLYVLFGPVCFFASLAATFVVFWAPQLVNAVCHLPGAGYKLFETRDDSLNVWWVAMLSHGEGWHNNHHAIPKSARHGMAWWEFDLTYVVIVILEKLGLAWDVVRPSVQPSSFKPGGPLRSAPAPLINPKAKSEAATAAKAAAVNPPVVAAGTAVSKIAEPITQAASTAVSKVAEPISQVASTAARNVAEPIAAIASTAATKVKESAEIVVKESQEIGDKAAALSAELGAKVSEVMATLPQELEANT